MFTKLYRVLTRFSSDCSKVLIRLLQGFIMICNVYSRYYKVATMFL